MFDVIWFKCHVVKHYEMHFSYEFCHENIAIIIKLKLIEWFPSQFFFNIIYFFTLFHQSYILS